VAFGRLHSGAVPAVRGDPSGSLPEPGHDLPLGRLGLDESVVHEVGEQVAAPRLAVLAAVVDPDPGTGVGYGRFLVPPEYRDPPIASGGAIPRTPVRSFGPWFGSK
jgi:hypothetical protein